MFGWDPQHSVVASRPGSFGVPPVGVASVIVHRAVVVRAGEGEVVEVRLPTVFPTVDMVNVAVGRHCRRPWSRTQQFFAHESQVLLHACQPGGAPQVKRRSPQIEKLNIEVRAIGARDQTFNVKVRSRIRDRLSSLR